MEEQNIVAYMPDQEQEMMEQRQADPYDRVNFYFDEATNSYRCPTAKKLEFKKTVNSYTRKQFSKIYEGVSCSDCPVKADCTSGSKRQIYWELREPLRDAMRRRINTKEGKQIYYKRLNAIEHVWGNIKFNCRVTMFHLGDFTK